MRSLFLTAAAAGLLCACRAYVPARMAVQSSEQAAASSSSLSRRGVLRTAAALVPLTVLTSSQAVQAAPQPLDDVTLRMNGKDVKVRDVLGSKATLVVSPHVTYV